MPSLRVHHVLERQPQVVIVNPSREAVARRGVKQVGHPVGDEEIDPAPGASLARSLEVMGNEVVGEFRALWIEDDAD